MDQNWKMDQDQKNGSKLEKWIKIRKMYKKLDKNQNHAIQHFVIDVNHVGNRAKVKQIPN